MATYFGVSNHLETFSNQTASRQKVNLVPWITVDYSIFLRRGKGVGEGRVAGGRGGELN